MANSPGYQFFLFQWKMKKADELVLQEKVADGKITQEEYNTIVATAQA